MGINKLILNGQSYDIGNRIEIDTAHLYKGRELSEYTWTQLKAKCKKADFDDLRIGDYKTIQLTGGETVVMQIAGIDTYYKSGDVAVPHHIDWISKDCLSAPQKWRETEDNNGTSETHFPYLCSDIQKILNTAIYETLPVDLKSNITNKRALLETRYSASGKLTESSSWTWADMGALWIPTEYEVFGSIICGSRPWSAGQGIQYPIFANSISNVLKGQGNKGSRNNWWLSTTYDGHKSYICLVDNRGFSFRGSPTNTYGVPLCFRIAA